MAGIMRRYLKVLLSGKRDVKAIAKDMERASLLKEIEKLEKKMLVAKFFVTYGNRILSK